MNIFPQIPALRWTLNPINRHKRFSHFAFSVATVLASMQVRAINTDVVISGFAFNPPTVTVHVGDTVTWTQHDSIQHSVTSDGSPALWNSGLLSLNQKFVRTFSSAGTFPYHCIPHASFMKGTIIVAPAPNQPPSVTLTSPSDGAVLAFPASFSVAANASDPDGSVASIRYFAGTNALGIVTNPPYQLLVTNLTAAVYSLTAVATDNLGSSTTSGPVKVTIDSPPSIRVTYPGSGALFLTPASLTLTSAVSDSDGTVTSVEYRDGSSSLGVTTSPFTLNWLQVPQGPHSITAIATDNLGIQTTSAPLSMTVAADSAYAQHNLVSDLPGVADHQDSNLANPWAIAFSPTGPFWINDNHSGFSTVYNTDGSVVSLVVSVPSASGTSGPGSPTGIVFNSGSHFEVAPGLPAHFIFASEDGIISGWNTGGIAVIKVDNSAQGTVYKGLAGASLNGTNFLYATDFNHGRVDVFNQNFSPVANPGAFTDPTIPNGYAPFGIRNLGGQIYVSYAMQDDVKHDDVSGAGHGFIDIFDTSGQFIKRLVSGGSLNSPWGFALAPAGFGQFSGDLLVGNFGDGTIQAYDPVSGAYWGTLSDGQSQPIVIQGLWDIAFGNGVRGGDAGRLYFSAGISGGGAVEDHGLFGSISAVPAVRITRITQQGDSITLDWLGGPGPFLLQRKSALTDNVWTDVQTVANPPVVIPVQGNKEFFRIQY